MSARKDRLILVAFADPNAFYQANPVGQRNPARFRIANFIEHARLAEDAGFDAIFKPDFLGFEAPSKEIRARAGYEPLSLLSALSQHTRRLGLIVTASTSYTEPYNVARYLTSLDHVSAGRASWNVVTSYHGETNFGTGALPPLAERYRRADEYLAVTDKLWSGWREGAVTRTSEGIRFDGNFIDDTDFTGDYYRVKEPLDLAPGPQGRPVIVQAGASEEGLDFAARHAEIVFAAAPDLVSGIGFYADLKRRVAAHGRRPEDLRVLPGLNIFIGATQAEAEDLNRAQFTDRNLLNYRDKIVREAPLFKLGALDLDDRIPADAVPAKAELAKVERRRSRGLLLHDALSRPGITLRQFLVDVYGFGHLTLVGTAQGIAEDIARWFESHAADGFVFKGGNDFRAVAEQVLPRLKEQGILRVPEREGLTFRQALAHY